MNNEEERKEQGEDKGLINGIKEKVKKANKSNFKMMFKKFFVTVVLPILLHYAVPILLIACVIGAVTYIFDLEGSSSIVDVASSSLLKQKENVDIAITDSGDGYYFKIDQKIIDNYLIELNKAYYEGYYFNTNKDDEEDDEKDEFVYDEEDADITKNNIADWFLTDDYEKYIIKMIKAEIASTYPKLGDYEGISSEDDVGNKKDQNGNYVAQGIVKIKRTKMNKDGTTEEPIELRYLPHDKLKELIDANDETALDYYTFDHTSKTINYAIYKEVITTVNGEVTERTYELFESAPMSYSAITEMCSMPYNFLFNLLQESRNPEWVMSVADLLLENSEVEFMIQDKLDISTFTHVETSYYVQKTVETTYSESSEDEDTEVTYEFPYGEPVIVTTITKTYNNTATVYLKKAKTWCVDFEQDVTPNNTSIPGKEAVTLEECAKDSEKKEEQNEINNNQNSNDEDDGLTDAQRKAFGGVNYILVGSTSSVSGDTTTVTNTYVSASAILYSISERLDRQSFGWTVGVTIEKRINYEKFLGLWKNDTGDYYKGCLFNPNGKLVGYALPEQKDTKRYPVEDISEENGQRIDELIELLELHSNTQMHEQLMRYYWNKYLGQDMYDVNLEGLLDFFNTNVVTTFGSSYGTISVNGCNITREDFISCVENYNTSLGYQERFGKYAGLIYDICVSKNINPILCVAIAGQESGFGNSVPTNSPFNYWGIAVYNNSNEGAVFQTMESGVEAFCDLMIRYQTPGTSEYEMIVNRSGLFREVNNKFSGGASNIYDVWSIYAWLGDDHQSKVYGTVNVKEYITRFLTDIECNHSLADPTTTEEQAAYIVDYIDNRAAKVGKDVFGSKAVRRKCIRGCRFCKTICWRRS